MSAGTIKLTNGSTAVVGTSTTFTTDLKSGDVITTTIGGVFYTLFVDTVTSNTALTLSDAFTGPTTTGAAYVAVPQMTLNRITAALAAQTAEAVRRVLQDNANWQAFYSGTGDITITLPNGTPTGLQISGPSWAKLSGIANTTWIDRGRMPDGSNINTFNPSTTEGTWHISGLGTVTTANGFPPGAQRGVLTVVNGGYNSGTQIYVDQTANQWVRSLTATWNGTDGPWSDWVKTGRAAMYDLGLGLSTMALTASLDWQNDDFVTGTINRYYWQAFTNPPTLTGPQPVGTSNMVVTVKLVIGTTIVVTLTALRGGAAYESYDVMLTGAKGSRVYTVRMTYQNGMSSTVAVSDGGTGASTPEGARSNLGIDGLGIGIVTSPLITAFDWQQADFLAGSLQSFVFSSSLNPPSGITYNTGTSVTLETIQARGNLWVANLTPLTGSPGNGREYSVTISGAKGARTFRVTQSYNSDSSTVIPLANGGTGANTAAAARTNLGLGGAAVLNVGAVAGTVAAGNDSRILGAVQNTGGNITGSFVLNAAGAYLSNTAAARYTSGSVTYLDIWRFTQVDIGGVGTQGNLQFVANPGNYLSFELAPGNGSHSFRHDGKIVTNAGTVAFVSSDGRIKDKKGKPKGSAQDRIRALASTATQDYLWLNYQGDFNTYRYEQPQRGFIAQDAYAVDPTYASKPQSGADDEMPENGDAIWGVNTNAIVADLVIAADAQQTDIEGLRQTVAEQQTQIAQLTSAIEQLSQQIQALSQADAQS